MAFNQHSRAHQAWRILLIHTRTEIMTYVDKMIADAIQLWDQFNFMDEDSPGPIDLYNPEWYTKNFAWGDWLAGCRLWARVKDYRLQGRIMAFQKMAAMYFIMFKDQENFESADYWTKMKDANKIMDCYLHGWKSAVPVTTFEGWMTTHPNSWANVQMIRNPARTDV